MIDTQISRGLLSDQVYDLVRASILDGSRAPGERLVESDIARRLSVSQAPVREALKKLVHEGLVTSVPRNGSYVTQISAQEFEIAREMRGALEQVGARLSAEIIDDEDLERLRKIVSRMRSAVDEGDWASFRVIDMEFHRSVLLLGNHAILSRLWTTLEPLLLSSRAIGDPYYSGDKAKLVSWHEELVAALETRDPAVAGPAFFAHAVGALDS